MNKKERICTCCGGNRIGVYGNNEHGDDGWSTFYIVRCRDCGSSGVRKWTEKEAWASFDKVNKALVARIARIKNREEEENVAAELSKKQKKERKRK